MGVILRYKLMKWFLKPERLAENLSDENIHKKINNNRRLTNQF